MEAIKPTEQDAFLLDVDDFNIEPVYVPYPTTASKQSLSLNLSVENAWKLWEYWFNDQVVHSSWKIVHKSEKNPILTDTNTIFEKDFNPSEHGVDLSDITDISKSFKSGSILKANFKKGVMRCYFSYSQESPLENDFKKSKYIEFVLDWKKYLEQMVDSPVDLSDSNEVFSKACKFFYNRNIMRFATVLAFYMSAIEIICGLLSPGSSGSGYFQNAVGDLAGIWLYGWGYQIFHGSVNRKSLNADAERIEARKKVVKEIETLHKNLKKPGAQFDKKTRRRKMELLSEYINHAKALGVHKDQTISNALNTLSEWYYSFENDDEDNYKESPMDFIKLLFKNFFWGCKCRSKSESREWKIDKSLELQNTGFYEMLGVAEMYSIDCSNGNGKTTIINSLIYIIVAAFSIGVSFGYFYQWVAFARCKNNVENFECSMVAQDLRIVFTGGFVLYYINCLMVLTGGFFVIIGLLYGVLITKALISSWLKRFGHMKRFQKDVLTKIWEDQTNVEASSIDPEIEHRKKVLYSLVNYIETDAIERYLFINNYTTVVGNLWQYLIAAILLVDGLITIFNYVELNIYFELYTIGYLIGFAGVWLVTFISVGYANSAAEAIQKEFTMCSIEHYSMIGGSEKWTNFTNNTPCQWKIFGFPITSAWVSNVVGGIVSAVLITLIINFLA